MSRDTQATVDAVLQNVKPSRRDLLKRLLVGVGAAALMVPMSSIVASAQETGGGKAKGKGKAKGRAKGKGKGKGRRRGKGKGKGKGSPD